MYQFSLQPSSAPRWLEFQLHFESQCSNTHDLISVPSPMRSQRWALLAVLALLTLGATDGSGSRKVGTFVTVRSCRVPHAHRRRVQADLKLLLTAGSAPAPACACWWAG